jgi:lysophospholipase L1-like esterase
MRKLLITYLVLLHLLIGIFVYRSVFTKNQVLAGDSPKVENPYSYYKESRTVLDRMDKNIPDGSIIFIGDSLTESLAVSTVTNEAFDFGIAGDFIEGVAQRLPDYHSLEKARAVVLLIGTNDAAFEIDNQKLEKNLREISNRIPSVPQLLWYAVPPVDHQIDKTRPPERIQQINLKIKEICASRSNCRFIDLTELLADKSGNLKQDYHIGDGYHFNERGYEIWIQNLKTQLPAR